VDSPFLFFYVGDRELSFQVINKSMARNLDHRAFIRMKYNVVSVKCYLKFTWNMGINGILSCMMDGKINVQL
jgi:hypothetical protein